jgi:NADPH:quinone reductase-like Zn-dependent oxidoreductase
MAEPRTSLPPTMKAWQYSNNRGGLHNLRLNDKATPPTPPKPGSCLVLLEVISMALNPADWKLPELPILPRFVIPKPASPGLDFCGRVISWSSDLDKDPKYERLENGQLVFGRLNWPYQYGTLAQFILCPRIGIAPLPPGIGIDHAAAIGVAAQTAYQSLAPYVKSGSRVFINGGSGGVGTFTIQIAKLLGCHVTVSCSGRNAELCGSLGADEVVDYTKGSLAEMLTAKGQAFDLLVDNVGKQLDLYKASDAFLAPGAPFVQVAASDDSLRAVLEMARRWLVPSFLGGGRHPWRLLMVKDNVEELVKIGQWVNEGKVKVVLDEVFKFEDAPNAYKKLRTGRARGKIVVNVTERPQVKV